MADEPRRTQAQQERRIRILETAMRLAGEGGYEAVQMRAVAEESGVALGTIYRYYSGKDEMLIAGLAGWLRRTRRRVESGALAAGALVVVEHGRRHPVPVVAGLSPVDERRYGDTVVTRLRPQTAEGSA